MNIRATLPAKPKRLLTFMTDHKTPRLALGTVQLGMPYGAANASGMPSEHDAVALIRAAVDAGISTIDTARGYGEAERRVGLALPARPHARVTVLTKLDPLAAIPPDDSTAALDAATRSLAASRTALGTDRLDCLMLHRAEHRTRWGGAVWRHLIEERDAGRIGHLGVSVQSPAEALNALRDPAVTRLQLPYNLLDHRWDDAGVPAALRQRTDVTVDSRSALLQGVLAGTALVEPHSVPAAPLAQVTPLVAALIREHDRSDARDLALAFVRAQDWIDNIVVGMETGTQLTQNLALFRTEPLSRADADAIRRALPRLPVDFLDPSRWHHNAANHSP
jgi:spore coat polysaccharide biosynthesis protein SpsF